MSLSASGLEIRSIRVLLDGEKTLSDNAVTDKVPVISAVKHGTPLLSSLNIESFINLGEPFVKAKKNYFAIYVNTDEFTSHGIIKGDLALIEQTQSVIDGQIAAFVDGQNIKLKIYNKKNCTTRIEGVLSNIIRSY